MWSAYVVVVPEVKATVAPKRSAVVPSPIFIEVSEVFENVEVIRALTPTTSEPAGIRFEALIVDAAEPLTVVVAVFNASDPPLGPFTVAILVKMFDAASDAVPRLSELSAFGANEVEDKSHWSVPPVENPMVFAAALNRPVSESFVNE